MKTIPLVFYALNHDLEPEAICFNEDWTIVNNEFKIWENVTTVIKDYATACKIAKIEALPITENPATLPNEPRVIVLFVKMRQLSDPSIYHNIAKAEPNSLRRIVEKKNWRPNDHESISPPPELYYQPIITIGYEDIMDLYTEKDENELATTGDLRHLESMRLDSRFKFFDSGIWHRYVPLYPRTGNFRDRFMDVLEKMAGWHQDHLYASNAARANLEFQLRMMKNSYIAKIGRTGHYEVVTPFKFHSETYIEEKIKGLEGYFDRFQRSGFRLAWRLLLIDDFATRNISSYEDRCKLSKRTLIEKILDSKAFKIIIEAPGQDNEIIDTCIKKLETNIFDVLLLDYLLGNTNKRKKKREYGHDFMMRLRSEHNTEGGKLKIGPLRKYWICPISSFPFALKDKLWQLGIHPFDDLWHLSNGGDPICTPALFKYNLLSFFERQIEETFSDGTSLSRLLNSFESIDDHKYWADSLQQYLTLNLLRINMLKNDNRHYSAFAGSVLEVIPLGYQIFLQKIVDFLNQFEGWNIEKTSAKEIEYLHADIHAPEGYQAFLEAFREKVIFFIEKGNYALIKIINNSNNSKEIAFTNGNAEYLPRIINQCSLLESLNLSGNKLQYLPDSIGELQYLGKIDLSGNQFSIFPKILGQFKGNLNELNFGNNPLKLSRDKAVGVLEVEKLINEGLESIADNQTQDVITFISQGNLEEALNKFEEVTNTKNDSDNAAIDSIKDLQNRFTELNSFEIKKEKNEVQENIHSNIVVTQEIKTLISQDELEEALVKFINLDKTLEHDIIHLQNRLTRVKRSEMQKTDSRDNIEIEKNLITKAVLDLVKKFEENRA